MKVCVTSSGSTLDSAVDPRFGRCEYFLIADREADSMEGIRNPNISSSGGAGIQSAQLVASKGANVVITGHVGPNAFTTLSAASVQIFIGATGTVKEALAAYDAGKLQQAAAPDSSSKSGISQ